MVSEDVVQDVYNVTQPPFGLTRRHKVSGGIERFATVSKLRIQISDGS